MNIADFIFGRLPGGVTYETDTSRALTVFEYSFPSLGTPQLGTRSSPFISLYSSQLLVVRHPVFLGHASATHINSSRIPSPT